MEMKVDMIKQKFKCSKCNKITTFSGEEGEVKIVECPYCSSYGKVRFTKSRYHEMPYFQLFKSRNYVKLLLTLVFTVLIFTAGFLSNSYFNYGNLSLDIDDLKYQIEFLQNGDNDQITYATYYQNETSLSDIYEEAKDSIVVISGKVAYQIFYTTRYYEVQGSGFFYKFKNENIVITNNHVVSDVSDIVVTLSNGNSYTAEIIGSDAYSDLAVLSVDIPEIEFISLEIVSSSDLEVGDPVIAIGNPMGLDSTMTTGIVSQIGRTIEAANSGSFSISNIIQTNVAINPGNSGGPLLNYKGEVVGITTAIIEDSEGLGFAIPSNTILREIESLVETGSYEQHPWLGISGVDMSYSIAEVMGVDATYGWLIGSITKGNAADEAGLRGGDEQVIINNDWVIIGGDIIIAIDGNRIINGDALMSYLEEYAFPGKNLTITIVRDNEQINIDVEVGIRSAIN